VFGMYAYMHVCMHVCMYACMLDTEQEQDASENERSPKKEKAYL
jgi:hypothetical protein